MKTRELHLWDQIEILQQEIHPIHQDTPDMIYNEAMLRIVKYRDGQSPLAKMKKVGKKNPDGLWHLNMAFLYAYNRKLRHATRHYRQASLVEIPPQIISEIESFMVWIIEQEPMQKHLFYCLGFFNWKIKGDEVQALKDFASFLALPLPALFVQERQLVQTWMNDLS
jgi:hypothetical protein